MKIGLLRLFTKHDKKEHS